jgi:hypothetical protein
VSLPLRIRYHPKEGVIRSEGDPPNGILMVGGDYKIGATLAIHPSVQPPRTGRGPGIHMTQLPGNAVAEGDAAPVDVEDVIDGCIAPEDIGAVWQTVMLATQARCALALETFAPEDVVAFAELAVKVRDAMVARGKREIFGA